MLLRRGLTIEVVHDIGVRGIAVNILVDVQRQRLALTQSIEETFSFVDSRLTRIRVNIVGICGRTAEPVAVEDPPVDFLLDSIGIGETCEGGSIVVLRLIEHVEPLTVGSDRWLDAVDGAADGAVVFNLGLALLATLRSDENDTGSSTRAVDSSGGIFQYGDVVDIVAVDGVELIHGTDDTVDDDERAGTAIDGDVATDGHGCTFLTRTGRGARDSESRHLTLQGDGRVGDTTVLIDVITLDLCDGTRQRGFLLRAVTGDDDLVKETGVLLQIHGNVLTCVLMTWSL